MKRPAGRPRRITDEQLSMLLGWRPLREVCRDIGVTAAHARELRRRYRAHGYCYKQKA